MCVNAARRRALHPTELAGRRESSAAQLHMNLLLQAPAGQEHKCDVEPEIDASYRSCGSSRECSVRQPGPCSRRGSTQAVEAELCTHTHTHTLPHMSAGRYKCVQRHKHCWGNMCTPRKGWQQTQPSDLGHGRFSQLQLAQIRLT